MTLGCCFCVDLQALCIFFTSEIEVRGKAAHAYITVPLLNLHVNNLHCRTFSEQKNISTAFQEEARKFLATGFGSIPLNPLRLGAQQWAELRKVLLVSERADKHKLPIFCSSCFQNTTSSTGKLPSQSLIRKSCSDRHPASAQSVPHFKELLLNIYAAFPPFEESSKWLLKETYFFFKR